VCAQTLSGSLTDGHGGSHADACAVGLLGSGADVVIDAVGRPETYEQARSSACSSAATPSSTVARGRRGGRSATSPRATVVHTGHGEDTAIGDEAPQLQEWLDRDH